MADLLEQGVAWLDGVRQSHLSQDVTYHRGDDSIEIVATMGATIYDVSDESGMTVQAKATDFIVTAADLILDSAIILPEVADQFRVTRGDDVLVFEVLDLGGAGHYQPSDPYGTTLRIHTKQVDVEDLVVPD